MYRIRRVLLGAAVAGLTLLSLTIQPTKTQMKPLPGAKAVTLEPFDSVELNGGAKAMVTYGSPQRVTIVKGSEDVSRVTVTNERLLIEKCRDKCPKGYELHVEIVTPMVNAISVANGGRIESVGNFPLHPVLSLAVAHGGMIDSRAISASNITAAVNQGGGILAKPQIAMVASVSNGGVITYWGNAQVTAATQHGGVVNKGAPDDLTKPLSEVDSPISCPTTPPARPASAKRSRTIVI